MQFKKIEYFHKEIYEIIDKVLQNFLVTYIKTQTQCKKITYLLIQFKFRRFYLIYQKNNVEIDRKFKYNPKNNEI